MFSLDGGTCVMASSLDGLGLEDSLLDGLVDWLRLATRKEWFRITRELVASTIADMDMDPAALAEVQAAFIGAGLLSLLHSKNIACS